MSEKRKLLYWEGSSKKDFKEFPVPVQKDLGVALFVVQLGGKPLSAKRWRGLGPGVYELAEDHRGDAFPAVYAVCLGDAASGCGIDREAAEGSARPPGVEREIVMAPKDLPRGTDNVLADLGFPDARKLSAKTMLASKLNSLIDARGLSQLEAARITGMTQPKVSQLSRYKLQNISLERLMQALVSLDQHVEIIVRPARRAQAAGITVAA